MGVRTHPFGSMSAIPAPASAVGFQVVTLQTKAESQRWNKEAADAGSIRTL